VLSNIPICRLFVRIFAPDCDVTKLEAKAEGGEGMKMLTYGANAVSLVLGTKLAMLRTQAPRATRAFYHPFHTSIHDIS